MNAEQTPTHEDSSPPPLSSKPISPARLWLERIGIGLVAAISLLIPLLIGLMFYLAVTDGLVVNASDPLHEIRLWMVQERIGATGLGLTIASPTKGNQANILCAHTSVTFLRWNRSLRLENEAGYCRCYERKGEQLTDASNAACQ